MKKFTLFLTVATASTCAFAAKAPKSAAQYYSDAAFQYIENRLPTAEITCKEGLSYYPDDAKLQMLQDRIEESKDEQQKQNQQNNPNNEKQDQNQNQQQDKQNQDQQNQQNQDQSGEQEPNEQKDQDNQNNPNENPEQGASSSSESENTGGSSNSNESNAQEEAVPPGQMTPQEASQLLKDFDEEHGERKPWKPVRGQARPEKDW